MKPSCPTDVLKDLGTETWDIVTSNPPYISPRAFNTETARSVRMYEPRLALVPPSTTSPLLAPLSPSTPQLPTPKASSSGDTFYPILRSTASSVNAGILVMEVGDLQQARRVASLALSSTRRSKPERGQWKGQEVGSRWDIVEIWRDWFDDKDMDIDEEQVEIVRMDGDGTGNEPAGQVRHRTIRIRGTGNARAVVCYGSPRKQVGDD